MIITLEAKGERDDVLKVANDYSQFDRHEFGGKQFRIIRKLHFVNQNDADELTITFKAENIDYERK